MPSLEEIKEHLAPIEGEWDKDLQALVPAKSYPAFQTAEEDFLKSLGESGWRSQIQRPTSWEVAGIIGMEPRFEPRFSLFHLPEKPSRYAVHMTDEAQHSTPD